MPLSYIFFGTPSFCTTALDELVRSGRPPCAVVCQPDRPSGRGQKPQAPPTKLWAEALRVAIYQPDRCKEEGFLGCCLEQQPDLGLVFAFGQLLPKALLSIPRLGFINIHPSLLPRYRGAAPIQRAVMNGDAETGVSIVRVTPKLDDGDILLQERTPIDPDETAVQLGGRLAALGGRLVVRAFELLEAGEVAGTPQDPGQVVWAPSLQKEDGRIDWNKPARIIHNLVRGVQPWPGATTTLSGKLLKVHRTRLEAQTFPGAKPGEIVVASPDNLRVATPDGSLRLLEVQLEGKRRLEARAFLLGHPLAVGTQLT